MFRNLACVDQGAICITLPHFAAIVGDFMLVFAVIQYDAAHQFPNDGSHGFITTQVGIGYQQPFIWEAGFHFCECDGFHFAFFFAKLRRSQGKFKVAEAIGRPRFAVW